MRVLIQRVKRGKVTLEGKVIAEIGRGLVVLLAVGQKDSQKEAAFLAEKVVNLRIMADEKGKMNLSVKDVNGQVLVVSQFTLYADASGGRRPSFVAAAKPELAKKLYERFIEKLGSYGIKVVSGIFGEYMQVEIINDGPVTILLETP